MWRCGASAKWWVYREYDWLCCTPDCMLVLLAINVSIASTVYQAARMLILDCVLMFPLLTIAWQILLSLCWLSWQFTTITDDWAPVLLYLRAQGATFNPDIVYAVAKATSDEVRAKVSPLWDCQIVSHTYVCVVTCYSQTQNLLYCRITTTRLTVSTVSILDLAAGESSTMRLECTYVLVVFIYCCCFLLVCLTSFCRSPVVNILRDPRWGRNQVNS